MAKKTEEVKKEKKEPKGITMTMKQLVLLTGILTVVFIGIGIYSWTHVSPAVGVNALAVALIAGYIFVRSLRVYNGEKK